MTRAQNTLLNIYNTMFKALGPSHWWPGESLFEICVGAILTQNTNWNNVEKAILNLKDHDLLVPRKLMWLTDQELADLIRPAGYFRIKAGRLKNFLLFLKKEVDFNIDKLKEYPLRTLREKLLSVKGIGPETADSMLLYGFEKKIFVVDAYTARIFNRHFLIQEDITYDDLQEFCMENLASDIELYKEFHALIVRTGKTWCKKKNPLCRDCPLYSIMENK